MPKSRKKNTRKKATRSSHHQYYSKMTYDGDTLSVESQQDNQPIKRKKYTLKQLRREIPVAAELINKYLDGKVPRSLHNYKYPQNTVSIYPVLPNPVDLGLIPPAMEESRAVEESPGRKYRNPDEFDGQNVKLYVIDNDGNRGVRGVREVGRNIGSLPYMDPAIDNHF